MALNYTHADGDGIFDILGKVFAAIDSVNTGRGTTVPNKLLAALNQFKKDDAATQAMNLAFANLPSSQASWQSQGDSLVAELANEAAAYLRGVVLRDASLPADTIDNALDYLIKNMVADTHYVDASAVGLTLSPDAGNSTNDLAILYTALRGDGQAQQNLLAEAIAVALTAVSATAATLRFLGKNLALTLSQDWPGGSGTTLQVAGTTPGATLIDNGGFETVTIANLPDDWILLDGVPGTDYLVTSFETQRIAISGTPTSGGYYIRFTHPNGTVYITQRLAFNATSAAVQAALRLLPDLGSVTVSTTGSSPNYTHDITFTGLAGNLTAITVDNQCDTGTFTISEQTAGDANAYRGKSLKVVGPGAATNRRIYQELPALTADTVYFIALRHKKTGTPVAGTVRVAVTQGIGGSVTIDSAGNANSKTFNLTNSDVTTSFTAGWTSFRLKPTEAQPCYLEINVQNLSIGTTYCLDDVMVVAGTELYPGGPFVAAMNGKTPPAPADTWTLTASNDRAGLFQTYFDRVFGMASRGLLLPTSGGTLIPDALIS